ncbi:PAS domain-containing protein [Aureimonas sp. Leaf454]|uniref:PAS domain-containing sensor histidine kinase n=1 Tax=Aureimonas sp. Leaf454 TaxID=1736381 RepID=UPI00138F6CBC|nr:PAS domain-containing protein [Aureimonas sp. Leaf454]
MNAKQPMFVAWGRDLNFIYNDDYAPIFGHRHPSALGKPFAEAWSDIWSQIEPIVIQTLSGEANFHDSLLIPMKRLGYADEAWFTFSYNPVHGEDGAVAGLLCVATETTRQVLAERSLKAGVDYFQSMADEAPAMMWITDPSGYCTYLNRRWYEFTGQTEEEALGLGWTKATHPDDQQRATDVFVAANAAQASFYVEYRLRRADGVYRLAIDKAEPRFGANGEYLGYIGSVFDIGEREEFEEALRESEENYRYAAELNPQTAWTAAADGQLDRVAERWRDWTGGSGLGASWGEAIHPDDLQPSIAAWTKSVTTGEPYDIEHRVRMVSGDYRWMHSRAYPRRDERGQIVRWYGTTEDVHERRLGEEHLQLLINELNHRVKNSLATVQAIAAQTFKTAETFEQSKRDFSGRLVSLAQAHDVLTETNWSGAAMREIVDRTVGPHGGSSGSRFHLQGPDVVLDPKSALAMSMALHELCTNAVKYGSLSVEAGHVEVTWRAIPSMNGLMLSVVWREVGGPVVTMPTRRGFGSRLIERGLALELGGEVRIAYDPAGVVCTIDAPLNKGI